MRDILLVARSGTAQILMLVALMFPACGQRGERAGEGEPCNAEIPCDHGLICSGGICVVDLCAAVECELGELCANGLCVSRNCEDRVCPEGLVCIDGDCVASSCVGVMCPADHACADGRCYPNDCPETYCGSGVCVNGECVPRSCVGVSCPEGQACGLGECYPVDCSLPCAPNEVCVGGQCTAISCVGVTCPAGTLCGLGLCWPVYCDDRDCPSGEVCVDGECTLPSCVGVVCPEGYACAAGECRLEACSEGLCGPGEVCDEQLDTCVAKACYGRVCPDGEICVAGGVCVSINCEPDCRERQCGPDPVCETSCGECDSGHTCSLEGTCIADACEPDCRERQCGPDPVCDASCGECDPGHTCDGGVCVEDYAPFSLDPTFGVDGVVIRDIDNISSVNWARQGLDIQPDGRILVAGNAGSTDYIEFAVLRLLPDGSPDPSFGDNGVATVDLGTPNNRAQAVRVQPDGRVLVAGGVGWGVLEHGRGGVARLLADGSLDSSFAGVGWRHIALQDGPWLINGAVILSDGRIRLCGQGWPEGSGTSDIVVHGLTADGAIETSFGDEGVLAIDFFGLDEFGSCEPGDADRLLAYGSTYHQGSFSFAAARVVPEGLLDPTFSDAHALPGRVAVGRPDRTERCHGITLEADGAVLCAGYTSSEGVSRPTLLRWLETGLLDSSFGTQDFPGVVELDTGESGAFHAVVSLPDGRIVAGGYTSTPRGNQDFLLAVFDSTGEPDPSVGDDGILLFDVADGQDDMILAMRLDGDRLVVFGRTTHVERGNDIVVMRLRLRHFTE